MPNCKLVNKHTRAGYNGKIIVCPECDSRARVFHFAWSALGCLDCQHLVDKYEWKLAD